MRWHNGGGGGGGSIDRPSGRHPRSLTSAHALQWLKKQTLDAAAVDAKPIARPDYDNPEGIH